MHRAESDPLEEPRHCPFPVAVETMDPQGVGDGIAHRHPRIEGAERVLKDDLHEESGPSQLFATDAGNVDAVERDGAGGRLEEADDDPSRVDFPHPDSPTTATTSPGSTEKLTSSTALIGRLDDRRNAFPRAS